jgi:hypothetical protein
MIEKSDHLVVSQIPHALVGLIQILERVNLVCGIAKEESGMLLE